jgi:hypothetical protein
MTHLDRAKAVFQCTSGQKNCTDGQKNTPLFQHPPYEVTKYLPPWDAAKADDLLAAVHARCNRARAREANTAARQAVIEVCRDVAVAHHRARDPIFWDELESLEALISRWGETDRWEGEP